MYNLFQYTEGLHLLESFHC